MDKSFWATRSGRWRIKLSDEQGRDFSARLAEVIADEIAQKQLPIGALLPSAKRVSDELKVRIEQVTSAYMTLLEQGLLTQDTDGFLSISRDAGTDKDFGEVTQVALEKHLIDAAQSARALGLTTLEATGMFKNTFVDFGEKGE